MAKVVYSCKTLSLLHILGKRWSVPIIDMLHTPRRNMQFNTMQMLLEDITPKNLSKSLKELTDAGIVKKTEFKTKNSLNTVYALTDRGVAVEQFIRSAKKLGVDIYNMDATCVNRSCSDCALVKTS